MLHPPMPKSATFHALRIFLTPIALVCINAAGCGDDDSPRLPGEADSSVVDAGPVVDSGDAAPLDAAPLSDAAPDAPVIPRPGPTVLSINPDTVRRAEKLVVLGSGCREPITVTIGGVPAVLDEVQNDRLVVSVPDALPLVTCSGPAEILVTTANGRSEPRSVLVRSDGPRVSALASPNVAAGGSLELKGYELADARVTLGDKPLLTSDATTTRIVVNLPRSTPTGLARAAVIGACGSMEVPLNVLERAPQIESVEPATLAAEGVAWIRADVARRDQITAVQVGNVQVPVKATDWAPPGSTAENVLAVRMPVEVAVGSLPLTLKSLTASSPAFTVTGISATYMQPVSTNRTAFAPKVADSETFPILTTGPFFQLADARYGPGIVDWYYDIDFDRYCVAEGNISGTERFGPVDQDQAGIACDPAKLCHPIEGKYKLGAQGNSIELTIDRTLSGGFRERYTGGWSTRDGTPIVNGVRAVWMALRSQSNGRQIFIDHYFDDQQCI